MPTYAGYKASQVLDLSAPLRQQMEGLMAERTAKDTMRYKAGLENMKFKRAQDAQFDKEYNERMVEISKQAVVNYSDADLKTKIYNSVNNGKEELQALSKVLNIPERRRRQTQMESEVVNLKTVVDNLGDLFTKQQDLIQKEGKVSYRQKYQMDKNKDLINLNNKDFVWDEDFNWYVRTYDDIGSEDRKIIKEEPVTNLISGAKINDQFVSYVDWDKFIEEKSKLPGKFTFTEGNKTITDVRQREGYNGWLNSTANSITDGDNPNRLVDLLMDGGIMKEVELDNGVVIDVGRHGIDRIEEIEGIYTKVLTDAETLKDAGLTEEEEKEIKDAVDLLTFITTEATGGKTEYSLKSEAIDFIKEKVKDKIEFNLDIVETKKKANNNKPTQTQKVNTKVAKISNTAWNNRTKQIAVGEDDKKAVKNHSSFEDLDKAYIYEYDPSIKAIKIYKRTWSGGFETTLKNDPERVAFSAEDLSPYATSIARAQTSFEEGGGKSNTGSGRIYKGIDPETGMPIYEEE
jgi:hypothetical protein